MAQAGNLVSYIAIYNYSLPVFSSATLFMLWEPKGRLYS